MDSKPRLWLLLLTTNLATLTLALLIAKFALVPSTSSVIPQPQPIVTPAPVVVIPNGWLNFENYQYNFSFSYPPSYKPEESSGNGKNPDGTINLARLDAQDNSSAFIVNLDPANFSVNYLLKYAPTGLENNQPQLKTFGQNQFYYFGPGGGGVNYPDQYFYNLNGQVLIFKFDGPPAAKQLVSQILSTLKFPN
jgi:hypothetical protein